MPDNSPSTIYSLTEIVNNSDIDQESKLLINNILISSIKQQRGRPKKSDLRHFQKMIRTVINIDAIQRELDCSRSKAVDVYAEGEPQSRSTIEKYDQLGRRLEASSSGGERGELAKIMRDFCGVSRRLP